jgi:hypothetical protein
MLVRKISPSIVFGPTVVYIGRIASIGDPFWGNPIVLKREGDRALVLAAYEAWLKTADHILARIDELRGCTVVCHCKPRACHGDILLEVAYMSWEARERWRVSELSCLDHDFEVDE